MQLRIYEPPRFFEAFLRGRALHRAAGHHRAHLRHLPGRLPDERAARPWRTPAASRSTSQIRALRRLLYCGEWIESHALHVYMLHAPDFLGYDGAIEMASDHRDVVERALRAEEGGQRDHARRSAGAQIHPVNVRVGGFYRVPDARRAARPRGRSSSGRATTRSPRSRWSPAFDVPGLRAATYEFVALRDPDELPDRVRAHRPSARPGHSPSQRSSEHVAEEHVAALDRAALAAIATRAPTSSGRSRGTRSTTTGCSPLAREAADAAGLGPTCRNPFRSIVVRAVELVYALRGGARDHRRLARRRRARPSTCRRAPAVGHGAPRRRAACSTTATSSTRTARSSTRGSSRRRRRTRPASSTTCASFVAGPAGPATTTS